MLLVSILIFVYPVNCNEEKPNKEDLNYGWLASEALSHKDDILTFLNTTRIREGYKTLYRSLLSTLIEETDSTTDGHRAGSTRRIVSGHNTSITSIPWQVSVREKIYPICGGTIVNRLWVLTAAHCLLRAKPADLTIRLGSSWKTHGGEMYDIKNSYVHPKYHIKFKVNDVGLLQLYTPLRFSMRIMPIKIISRSAYLPANVLTIVSGWGKVQEGGPTATYLQASPIQTIVMKLCKQSGLNRNAIDPATMFCAGSFRQSSSDACQGDSGGPIVYEGELIGAVSWGLGCARGNFPGVYTRLSSPDIWDWIREHISQGFNETIEMD